MPYNEDDFLMLSGLQHFTFCRRQWALIHLEQQWSENYYTASGRLMHENAHDPFFNETRGDRIISRAMPVHSCELGLSGNCDIVEFRASSDGIHLNGHDGLWVPCPVEYKRGRGTAEECDEVQLAAQAMCLEEMMACKIPAGAIWYGETRRRTPVPLTAELRRTVRDAAAEMHRCFEQRHTPEVKISAKCRQCSLTDLCLPKLSKVPAVSRYYLAALEEPDEKAP